MDAKTFLQETARMCKAQDDCENCPIKYNKNSCLFDNIPGDWAQEEADRIVDIVEMWANEHPRKTRLQDFLEKYPNAKFVDGTEIPKIYPINLGYCKADCCALCPHKGNSLPQWCWNQEVEEK